MILIFEHLDSAQSTLTCLSHIPRHIEHKSMQNTHTHLFTTFHTNIILPYIRISNTQYHIHNTYHRITHTTQTHHAATNNHIIEHYTEKNSNKRETTSNPFLTTITLSSPPHNIPTHTGPHQPTNKQTTFISSTCITHLSSHTFNNYQSRTFIHKYSSLLCTHRYHINGETDIYAHAYT